MNFYFIFFSSVPPLSARFYRAIISGSEKERLSRAILANSAERNGEALLYYLHLILPFVH